MYINFLFIIFLIYVLNISHIYAFKIKNHKNHLNFNLKSNIEVNSKTANKENKDDYISLKTTKDNLYYFDIEVGTPGQIFSVLVDTGSNFFWINNEKCSGCNSQRKFYHEKSKTFNYTNNILNLNYISGDLSGKISTDIIKFNNNKKFPNFNFVLINESNIDFELDGIFGLSKNIKDINNYEFSPLNQINNYIFTLDFPNKNLYIEENPSYLDLYNNISCQRKSIHNLNNYYWKCISKEIQIDNSFIKENNIIFDSGINSIVFSLNYIPLFKNILINNKLLIDAKCEIKSSKENTQIFSIFCESINNLIDKENEIYTKLFKDDFITIYLEHNKRFSLNFENLYDKKIESFKLYFMDITENTIILGIPFFEKYIVSFNQDKDVIIIYDPEKENIFSKRININLILIICIGVIILLIGSIIYYIYYQKNRISLYKLIYQK